MRLEARLGRAAGRWLVGSRGRASTAQWVLTRARSDWRSDCPWWR